MFALLGLSLLQVAASPLPPTPAAASSALCANPEWREAFKTEGLECVAARHGVAIGPSGRAKELAPLIDAAAARYAANFGPPAKPMAVISSSSVSGAQTEFLQARGFLSFPWPEQNAAPQSGPGSADAANRPERDAGVVAHELGHMWFKDWFDAERPRQSAQYASSAPDWLDETAAILNENDYLTAQRRSGLADLLDGEGPQLRPLAEFLTMSHPTSGARAMRFDPNNLPPGAIVRPDGSFIVRGLPPGAVVAPGAPSAPGDRMTFTVPGQASPERLRTGLPFYTQARAFVDFLMEKSGQPKIMGEIATAMRGGGSFEQWLAANGERHRLPSSLAALTPEWEAWLKGKAAGG